MTNIILIETSTALCSVALSQDGVVKAYRESSAQKAHASLTAVFVKEVLEECGLDIKECSAVCVSMGPGSYTGLRVGVSTAKGLCFGGGLPLLAAGTLDTLVSQAVSLAEEKTGIRADGFKHIIPMIDARRMEVYSAVFQNLTEKTEHTENSPAGNSAAGFTQITETLPAIIDENSFAEYLEQGPVLFIGDGAEKCSDVIGHRNAHFIQCYPDARSMAAPAEGEFSKGNFRDVAYFEPFYLKEFVATVSKKKMW